MINILWDMDGTIIDSMPVISSCFNQTAEHFGYPSRSQEQLTPLIGPGLNAGLSRLLDTQDEQQIAAARTHFRLLYHHAMLSSPVFPGMETVLNHFKSVGAKQYIATAKIESYACDIVRSAGLSAYFTGIYGAMEDGTRADKTELLGWLMREENLKASDTIIIGDTKFDIQAGRHHDLTTIGALWGYSDEEALKRCGVHQVASHPEDLIEVVKQSMSCHC